MTMVINGSGTITGLTAGGLPSATVTQATLATPVAGTGPAFSAYQSSSQTISNGTDTKVTLTTEEFDTNSCYDTSTSRFTPNVAGYYQINGAARFTSSASGAIFGCYVTKNGTTAKRGVIYIAGTTDTSSDVVVSTLIYMNGSTDYLEFGVYQSSGASRTLDGAAISTYFQGFLARSA